MLYKAGFAAVVIILSNISASAGRSLVSRQSSTIPSIPNCPQCTTFSNDLQPCSINPEAEVKCLCTSTHLQDLADCFSCAPDPSQVASTISPNMSPAQLLQSLVSECQGEGIVVAVPTLSSAQPLPSSISSAVAEASTQNSSADAVPTAPSGSANPSNSLSAPSSVPSGSLSTSSNSTQTAAVTSSTAGVASPSVSAQPSAGKASRSVSSLPLLGLIGAAFFFSF